MRKLKLLLSILYIALTSMNLANAQEADEDPGYPRIMVNKSDSCFLYQPQIDSWDANVIKAKAAVEYKHGGQKNSVFGVIWLTTRTDVDKPNGMVYLSDIKIEKFSFPGEPDEGKAIVEFMKSQLPQTDNVALDRIQSNLDLNNAIKSQKVNVKNDAPEIIFSQVPATLTMIDGTPVPQAVEGSSLQRVINTSALVLYNPTSKKYFIPIYDNWVEAVDLPGPWTISKTGLDELKKASDIIQKKDSLQIIDEPSEDVAAYIKGGNFPTTYVATKPTELIITNGKIQWDPISGTNLLYAKNTPADVFRSTTDNQLYVLLSGRWFKSANEKGPWTFVSSDKLPADFAKIPDSHVKSNVLIAVAGTEQSKEAVISSNIPQTAQVDRSESKFNSQYDGSAKFIPIENTELQYAKNSSVPIIMVSPYSYYACSNGVWYYATSSSGPWSVATVVPSVIYTIPASSPVYYVTYVRIYSYSPTIVYVGYYPGYMGCYVSPYGTVVYGTGYYYQPWVGHYYYGYPCAYGWGASFGWSSYSGWHVSFGFGGYSPYYNPWWHGGYGYGYRPPYYRYPPHYRPPGYRPVPYSTYNSAQRAKNYNDRYGSIDRSNVYGNQKSNGITSRPPTATTRPSYSTGGTKPSQQPVKNQNPTTGRQPSTLPANTPNTGRQNNVYVGPDNNVYQNNKGNWQNANQSDQGVRTNQQPAQNNTRQQAPSNNQQPSRQTQDYLQQQNQSRQQGQERYNYQQQNSGGSRQQMQSAPSGGGGNRGGGSRPGGGRGR